MSFRYASGFNKPGFNPLGAQTSETYYDLYSWGDNTYGQLGLSNTTSYSSPRQVGASPEWEEIASWGVNYHFLATKPNGTLWTWGANSNGQLGLGNTANTSSPQQVGLLTTWSTISAGYNNSFAIKTDGTLWSWGSDASANGVLGHGNTTSYSSPKQVGALTNWSTVASGFRATIAVKTDGTLWTWGANYFGTLGLGNLTDYSSPKQVGALTNWLKVSAGYASVFSIKTDGTLWAWGYNAVSVGALGLNSTTYAFSSPQQVGALTNWASIKTCSTGPGSSVATQTNGTMWTWGENAFGELGLGTTANRSSPTQVGALTSWQTVSGGRHYMAAIKTDGTLWSWGQGSSGKLGLGNTTNYSSPKQIGALTIWSKVATSNLSTIALG